MTKAKESTKPTEVTTHKPKCIPLSKAMTRKAMRMNQAAKTLGEVSKSIEAQAQKAQADLNDYLLYCRDELNAPESKYDLKRVDVGFELKPPTEETP